MGANAQSVSATARALEELCRIYRRPLVVALQRKHGFNPHDAEDITHDFLAWLLRQQHLSRADSSRGRFRTFLMTYLDNFVRNHRQRLRAEKRGGMAGEHVLVHESGRDNEPAVEVADNRTPDVELDRAWALAALTESHNILQQDYEARGKSREFEVLRHFVSVGASRSAETARMELGLSDAAFRVALHRFRKDFRATLESLVADTVSCEQELREELQLIRQAAV